MADIEARRIDIVVVYKIDRLTRALTDFAKLIEVLDRNAVTFVSVTQSFNTTTSMGRLMLNVLLSFAQFEREVTGERIRDKFAASRKKGMWMGGWAPLGYDIKDRKLIINTVEAGHVRFIFERFAQLRSVTKLIPMLAAEGIKAKSGKPVEKGYLYRIIRNPVYVGEAVHKGTSYPGEHKAIINRALWQRVQDILRVNPRKRAANSRARTPALLKGLIFGPNGTAMTPSHTRRNGKLYRYYLAMDVLKRAVSPGSVSRIAAGDVERAVLDQLRTILRAPEIIIRTWRTARRKIDNVTEAEVRGALEQLDPLWNELFPAEQARIVRLLVERLDIQEDGIEIRFRVDGLASLVEDFKSGQGNEIDLAAVVQQSRLVCDRADESLILGQDFCDSELINPLLESTLATARIGTAGLRSRLELLP
jgi:site-specific DNA recombinase